MFHNAAGGEPDHLHLDVRHLVVAPPGAVATTNHESDGVRWVPLDELAAIDVDDGTLRMVRSAVVALDELLLDVDRGGAGDHPVVG